DKASDRNTHPELGRCLKSLTHGDVLVVWKLDRLGRSLRDLIALLDELKGQGVRFQSLTEAIDIETPAGRTMWQMMGVIAELERSRISKGTKAKREAAQRRGGKLGRPLNLPPQQATHARKLVNDGQTPRPYRSPARRGALPTLSRA